MTIRVNPANLIEVSPGEHVPDPSGHFNYLVVDGGRKVPANYVPDPELSKAPEYLEYGVLGDPFIHRILR